MWAPQVGCRAPSSFRAPTSSTCRPSTAPGTSTRRPRRRSLPSSSGPFCRRWPGAGSSACAWVWHVPVVFVCQNNQWAISVPLKKQTHSKTIAQKALAYGLPGIQVDGNDVLAVYTAAREAVERARAGEGPTLIECVTYRLGVHTTADDPTKYRTQEEVTAWEQKDPLTRFRAYLEKKDLLEDGLEQRVDEEIAEAVRRFEATPPPDPLLVFDTSTPRCRPTSARCARAAPPRPNRPRPRRARRRCAASA